MYYVMVGVNANKFSLCNFAANVFSAIVSKLQWQVSAQFRGFQPESKVINHLSVCSKCKLNITEVYPPCLVSFVAKKQEITVILQKSTANVLSKNWENDAEMTVVIFCQRCQDCEGQK